MQCAACGAILRPTHKICINCGAAVGAVQVMPDVVVLDLEKNGTSGQTVTDESIRVTKVDPCCDESIVFSNESLVENTVIGELDSKSISYPLRQVSASQANTKAVKVANATVEESRTQATLLGAHGAPKMLVIAGSAIALIVILLGVVFWFSMVKKDEPVEIAAQIQEARPESIATVAPTAQPVIPNTDVPQKAASSTSQKLVTMSRKVVDAKPSSNHKVTETHPPVSDSEPATQTIIRESVDPKKTLDERYQERITAECPQGFIPGLICREKIRWEMCEGKWSSDGRAGQLTCIGAAKQN